MRAAVRAAAWLAVAALAGACGDERAAPPSPAAPPVPAPVEPLPVPPAPPPAAPSPVPAAAGKRAAPGAATTHLIGTPFTQAQLIEQLKRAEPQSFKPVGSTSTVFRTQLAGVPFEAAFKTATHEREHGPLAEIGAAAVARCLGLDIVPPAVGRSVSLEFLRAHTAVSDAEWQAIAARLEVTKNGRVPGALIYWIPDLGDVGLNKAEGLARAKEWLRVGGTLPAADADLAASVSQMVGFDYIIGNFDRWSGSNTKGNAGETSVYVRDHDLALPSKLGEPLHKRIASQMLIAERVSRGLYAYAQGLSRDCIEREVALAQPEDPYAEKLSELVLAGVLDRRDGFLSHVEALRAQHGDEAVLFFP